MSRGQSPARSACGVIGVTLEQSVVFSAELLSGEDTVAL